MEKLPTYADVTVWKDYQGLTLDNVYAQKWGFGIDCIDDKIIHKSVPPVIYSKVLKQTGDTIYAIILIYGYERQGIMKLNMNIDKFKGLYFPCPEIKDEFDSIYNKVKLNLKELVGDYDTSA